MSPARTRHQRGGDTEQLVATRSIRRQHRNGLRRELGGHEATSPSRPCRCSRPFHNQPGGSLKGRRVNLTTVATSSPGNWLSLPSGGRSCSTRSGHLPRGRDGAGNHVVGVHCVPATSSRSWGEGASGVSPRPWAAQCRLCSRLGVPGSSADTQEREHGPNTQGPGATAFPRDLTPLVPKPRGQISCQLSWTWAQTALKVEAFCLSRSSSGHSAAATSSPPPPMPTRPESLGWGASFSLWLQGEPHMGAHPSLSTLRGQPRRRGPLTGLPRQRRPVSSQSGVWK